MNTNNTNDRNASVQISAERIRLDIHPIFYALPLHIQEQIREYLDDRPTASIWSVSELMDAYLATRGIFGYTTGILEVAHAINNPLPPAQNDPNRSVYNLELSFRIQKALTGEGINTLGQLAAADLSRLDLYKIPFIGKVALKQINEVLTANGYEAKV